MDGVREQYYREIQELLKPGFDAARVLKELLDRPVKQADGDPGDCTGA